MAPASKATRDSLQRVMGSVYLAMGLATMLGPSELLLKLFVDPKRLAADGGASLTLSVVFRCFGAQAAVAGALALSSEFTLHTWRVWALSMAPFVVFDWAVWRAGMVTPLGAVGDLAGNLVFLGCSAAALYGGAWGL